MPYMKKSSITVFTLSLLLCLLFPGVTKAEQKFPHPSTYMKYIHDVEKHKKPFDDPTPLLKVFGPKQVLPPELWEFLSYDIEEMKKQWAEIVGFKAPDVVGKIAPEIKPGKYTWEDVQNNLGFKELMFADMYNRMKPGGPPHIGNMSTFEIVPTKQYYYALPVCKATKENMGKTKLDEKGYMITESYIGGLPFPRPSGKFIPEQLIYNVEKRQLSWGLNSHKMGRVRGFTKDLKMDLNAVWHAPFIKLSGRVYAEPYGFYDERAKARGEYKMFILYFTEPRDIAGAAQSDLLFNSPEKVDQLMMYVPAIRRIRKMSSTDSQDPIMGFDMTYDDNEGFMQKISPTRFPFKYEVIAEREFLVPTPSWDGSEYITSDNKEFRNVKFERRPMYVLQMTQLDDNYIYGKRIMYIDKEHFNFSHVENFDQKGRLYRTFDVNYGFHPEMGAFSWAGSIMLMRDFIDTHSSCSTGYDLPAFYTRKDVGLKAMMKGAK